MNILREKHRISARRSLLITATRRGSRMKRRGSSTERRDNRSWRGRKGKGGICRRAKTKVRSEEGEKGEEGGDEGEDGKEEAGEGAEYERELVDLWAGRPEMRQGKQGEYVGNEWERGKTRRRGGGEIVRR
jgi:hypothetical protein